MLEDLKAWHTDWLLSVEREVRLLRLRALLEENDGELRPHSTTTHVAVDTFHQTTLWPASSVSLLYVHDDVHRWAVDMLDLVSIRVFDLQEQARSLLGRSAATELFPRVGFFGPLAASMRPYIDPPDGLTWAPVLAGAIQEYEPFAPEYGTCLRCAVVRPVRSLHSFRSPTFPIPIYVCAYIAPPPDRLRPSLDDHWGSPCGCLECRVNLSFVGGAPLLFGFPAADQGLPLHDPVQDLLSLLRGVASSAFPWSNIEHEDPQRKN